MGILSARRTTDGGTCASARLSTSIHAWHPCCAPLGGRRGWARSSPAASRRRRVAIGWSTCCSIMPDRYLDRRIRIDSPRCGAAGRSRRSGGPGGAHEPPANSASRGGSWCATTPGSRTGVLQIHARQQMPAGARLLVSGKIDVFNGRVTIAHPDHVAAGRPAGEAAGDRAGVAADRRACGRARWPTRWPQALALLPELPEWHDAGAAAAGELARLRRGAARGAGAGGCPPTATARAPRL